jgi:hypothetical protein
MGGEAFCTQWEVKHFVLECSIKDKSSVTDR